MYSYSNKEFNEDHDPHEPNFSVETESVETELPSSQIQMKEHTSLVHDKLQLKQYPGPICGKCFPHRGCA